MKILVACEESQAVTKEFRKLGHEAFSCDTQECSGGHPEWHIQEDVLKVIGGGKFKLQNGECISIKKWTMMIGFPPCTYTTVSANRHIPNNPERWKKQFDALIFFYNLWNAPIEFIGLENPIGVVSTYIGKPDQIIHPYYFGDPVPKKTCLWLKNLPPLKYSMDNTLFDKKTATEPEYLEYNSAKTKNGKSRYSVLGKLGKGHGKERSKTFPGIARAMASQWSEHVLNQIECK